MIWWSTRRAGFPTRAFASIRQSNIARARRSRLTQFPARRILYGSISAMSYLADGSLVVSAEDQLFLYSSKFIALPPKSTKMSRSRIESVETEPIDSHTFAAGRLAPLPWHHPQLLFQSLLTGSSNSTRLADFGTRQVLRLMTLILQGKQKS